VMSAPVWRESVDATPVAASVSGVAVSLPQTFLFAFTCTQMVPSASLILIGALPECKGLAQPSFRVPSVGMR